jgi:hypothetical protein
MSKVNIENLTLPEGVHEVVVTVREGDALALEQGKRLALDGNINAPAEFYLKRKPAPQCAHVVVSKASRSIKLVTEEACEYQGTTVTGRLILAKEIESFGINTTKRFTHKQLVDLLKQYGFIFEDKDAIRTLIEKLQSFRVTVHKTVEDIDNQKGSVKKLTEWKAVEDITFKFKIKYPIYSGMTASVFSVDACLDVTDRDVTYYLVSGELIELQESLFQQCISIQLEILDDLVIIKE